MSLEFNHRQQLITRHLTRRGAGRGLKALARRGEGLVAIIIASITSWPPASSALISMPLLQLASSAQIDTNRQAGDLRGFAVTLWAIEAFQASREAP